MGASLAMAGMTACTKQPLEPIVPYVKQPEEIVPGKPLFFATAFTLGGYAAPLLVESHLYRPTKIEGNDKHPVSLGGTDVFSQASVLGLYDPDRSQNVIHLGNVSSWGQFKEVVLATLKDQNASQGAGIRVLTGAFSSPALADQSQAFLKLYPQAKWHVYEPVNRDNAYEGAKLAFGQPVDTQYQLENADVIVTLDADFLYAGFPGFTKYARDYAKRRDPDSGNMSRMYAIESSPTSTGLKSDHRLPVRAVDVEMIARQLAGSSGGSLSGAQAKFVASVVKELQAHRGSSVVIPGEHQPPAVHALAHAINAQLGNVGKTVVYTDTVVANPANQTESLKDLVADMKAGKVQWLIVSGVNPLFDSPADVNFADAFNGVPNRVHLGLYQDETAEQCHWHINETHYLESWGDTRAFDGTVSIVQPLIAPLYDGKSLHELLGVLSDDAQLSAYNVVQDYWRKQHPGSDFDLFWRRSLHDGWVQGTTYTPKQVSAKSENFSQTTTTRSTFSSGGPASAIEINFRPDPSIYDGRFSNNAWLQELPKPLSKLTWDNAVWIGPVMAERMGVATKDLVRVEVNGAKVDLPVWIQAGHPDNSITVFLGYGRKRAGRAGTGAGFDVYPLRTTATPYFTTGAQVTKISGTYLLASTQGYQTMDAGDETRPIVRTATLEEYKQHADFNEEKPPAELTLYPGFDAQYKKEPYAWGMTIDLNSCVGCNNCIIACQSENNIAVVGKEQVNHGRHMHWIRVDAYYQGDRSDPQAYFQPVPCMQCENAPCELVCPVGATTHSTEGLNDMVYNRCVGTRYCSNNCPYKVRRFNFFLFSDWDTPQYKMMRNPDVTVRSRGVMEKCTYCVQRISEYRIKAEESGTTDRNTDGDLKTACQQSCPANAIIFGNINDANSQVSKLKAKQRNYGLLDDLNTRPRTTYLAEIRNPNPELQG
jgi:molybdopterin-containing oxidoreductase family iron-sulfur binding subunit